jgi:hypothetical protein
MNDYEREDDIVQRGRAGIYDLVQRELATGELMWTFVSNDGARQPCFVTRREAVGYIEALLD